MILAMARSWSRDDARAEDLTQDVLIRVWRTASNFDPDRGAERTWVATITRRVLIDAARSRGATPLPEELSVEAASTSRTGLASAVASEESRTALAALADLKPEWASLIQLSLMSGLSHSEIASHTGLPIGTVKSRLRAALESLRSRLAPSSSKGVKS
tara:strand:- start:2799 stop:3272 length:474 start_codon:yes stop_codon:yes gene_type:complete